MYKMNNEPVITNEFFREIVIGRYEDVVDAFLLHNEWMVVLKNDEVYKL